MAIEKEYFAFISYQREDEEWAKWLAHELEHYHFPVTLNGRKDLPKNLRPVFRDVDELSAGNLPNQIHKALANSKHLIVICSPRSAQSKWVNKEIEEFIGMRRTDQIFPFIIDGKAFAENKGEECFPPALLNLPKEEERLGGNINEIGRDAAVVKIIAGMLDLDFDLLWQRYEREKAEEERRIREQRENLLKVQSKFLAEKSITYTMDYDSYTGRMFALAALPDDIMNPNRPYVPEAEFAIRKAIRFNDAILRGHTANIHTIAFSPSGDFLLSGSNDKTIKIWSTSSGRIIDSIQGSKVFFIQSVCYNHNGDMFASYDNGQLQIWNSKTQLMLKNIHFNDSLSRKNIEFHPSNKEILLSGFQFVGIWNLESGELIRRMDTSYGDSDICSAHYSLDGDRLYLIFENGNVVILDAHNYNVISKLFDFHDNTSRKVVISKDCRFVAIQYESCIEIWNSDEGILYKTISDKHMGLKASSFSPNNRFLSSASNEMLYVWDIESEIMIAEFKGHAGSINSTIFHPNNTIIASCSLDRTIRLWDLKPSVSHRKLVGHAEDVYSVSYDNTGKHLLTISRDKKIIIWDRNAGIVKYEYNIYDSQYIVSCLYAIFTSIDYIIITLQTNSIVFVDMKSSKHISEMKINNSLVEKIAYCKTKNIIATSAGEEDKIKIWDMDSKMLCKTLNGHKGYIKSISFNHKGNILASGDDESIIKIWHYSTGYVEELLGHTGAISCLCFSPDDKFLVSGSEDGSIKVWDAETGEKKYTLEGHSDEVLTISFNKKGDLLASGSNDGYVKIWDVETGSLVASFIDYEDEPWGVNMVCFSPEGNEIAAAYNEGRIRLWAYPPLQDILKKERERFKLRSFSKEEQDRYYIL